MDIEIEDEFLEDIEQKFSKSNYEDIDEIYQSVVEEADKIVKAYFEQTNPGTEIWTADHAEWARSKSVEELITSDEFLGLKPMNTKETPNGVYPAVLEDCMELWEDRKRRPIDLALFEEAFGSGKTFKASILLWLQWFDLCKYTNPQKYFNLSDDSWICFMCFSRTETLARKVCFTRVWERFKCSFNRRFFPAMPYVKREIRINRNHSVIYAGTSSALSAIGYDLYGAMVDEVNFLEVIEDSKKSADDFSSKYDEAEDLHDAVKLRMVSRFIRNDGTLPGFIVACCSARYKDDFTDRKIKIAKLEGDASGIFYRRRDTVSSQPEWFYPTKEYFYIDTDTYEEVPEESAKVYLEVMNAIEEACVIDDKLVQKVRSKITRVPLDSIFEDNL